MSVKDTTLKFVKEELPSLLHTLDLELAERVEREQRKTEEITEEWYYRIIWKVYKLSYIDKKLKDLIYLYKAPEILTDEERKNVKDLLIKCNTALILSIMSWILSDKDVDHWITSGELIAEGFEALTKSLEKYEVDFTHEKSTKNTKVKFKEFTEEWILISIESNKPFWTLDVTIKNPETKEIETLNREITWIDERDLYLSDHLIPFDELENEYDLEELKDVKLKVSKKVWHPSTFFTNNIFFALKNYLTKNQLLSINSNSYILKNQVSKLNSAYEEIFHKLPSDRWLSYYLLTQNWEVQELTDTEYSAYTEYVKNKKKLTSKKDENLYKDLFLEIELFLIESKEKKVVLLKSKDTKRLLMMKSKNAKSKNKSTFEKLRDTSWDEDLQIYTKEFEKRLAKKEKEIQKVKFYLSWVDSLDKKIWDDEGSTLWDLIWDDTFEKDLSNLLNLSYNKEELLDRAKKILSPREYFYFTLYYRAWIDLKDLSWIWLYQDNSITEVKWILRKCFWKIWFWVQYKAFLNNN